MMHDRVDKRISDLPIGSNFRRSGSRRLNPANDKYSPALPDTALACALLRAIEVYIADERHTTLPQWMKISLAGRTQLRRGRS